jgi:3-phenylpropionate/cinnamic acid dioxygenase small subunit
VIIVSANDSIAHQQVIDFLLHETSLLDERRLQDWLQILSEDFTYKIPVTSTPEGLSSQAWSEDYLIVDETKDSLTKLWLVRQTPKGWGAAWGENPAQRVRRFVTNTRISQSDESDSYVAKSNVLLSFVRESEPVILVPAERIDLVRGTAGGMRLARRLVKIDTSVVRTGHLRLIF